MNVFEKTEDLALSLRALPEFKEFLEIKDLVESNDEATGILKEYRARQLALEFAEMAGEGVEEVNRALEDICMTMEKDELLSRFLTAEFNLSRILQRVQDIFITNLGLIPETNVTGLPESDGRGGFIN